MQRRVLTLSLVLAWTVAAPALAQFKEAEETPNGVKMGDAQVQRWQFGLTVSAGASPCTAVGYVPVPIEWPEQHVAALKEDFSPTVKVRFQTVEGTVRLMIVEIPHLPAGEQAKALLTFEVQKRALKPPEKTDIFTIPKSKKLPREIKAYLAPSLLIECKSPKVKAALKETGFVDKEKAWDQVEAIYDWVRGKVTAKKGSPKGAVAALRDGEGDVDDSACLFIALCRAADVPARTVWVPGHCYAEFYLMDNEDNGHWFPCELSGNRVFGGINDHRPVLEKGDNFRAPYDRRERQRFLMEYLDVAGGKPKHKFIRQAAAE